MAVGRQGTRIATPETLIADAGSFSCTSSEAWDTLQAMAQTNHSTWRELFVDGRSMSEANVHSQGRHSNWRTRLRWARRESTWRSLNDDQKVPHLEIPACVPKGTVTIGIKVRSFDYGATRRRGRC